MGQAINHNLPTGSPPASRRRILIPIVVVLAAGLAYGIYWLIVVRGTVYTDDAQTQGLLEPCSSRVGGRVVEVLAWEGQTVSKGQVLARLDDMPYRSQRDEAQAGVAVAQAQLDVARMNLRRIHAATAREVAMAEAEVKAAEAKEELARKEKDRFDNVHSFVAQEAVDQMHTAWSGSDAALTVAKNKLSLLMRVNPAEGDTAAAPRELEIKGVVNQLALAEANLDLAQAKLELAESNFAEIEVKAPADGQISRRHVDPGQVAGAGQKLFSITVAKSLWVEANFEEGDIAEVRPGDPAAVKVDAYPGREFSARVDNVMPASISRFSLLPAGASSGNFVKVTQRVPVRVTFTDQDLPFLFPGLNVEVRIHVDRHSLTPPPAEKPPAGPEPEKPAPPAPAPGSSASPSPAPADHPPAGP